MEIRGFNNIVELHLHLRHLGGGSRITKTVGPYWRIEQEYLYWLNECFNPPFYSPAGYTPVAVELVFDPPSLPREIVFDTPNLSRQA
jgi:hypothetical protein